MARPGRVLTYVPYKCKPPRRAQVRLYRPWNSKVLLAQIPATVRKVAVLDRTKEPGSGGEPLYQQIAMTLHEAEMADPALP